MRLNRDANNDVCWPGGEFFRDKVMGYMKVIDRSLNNVDRPALGFKAR